MSTSFRPPAKAAPREVREACERESRRRFIAARRVIGLSQLEVAMRLGSSRSAVEDWERGATRIPGWALVAIEGLAKGVAA